MQKRVVPLLAGGAVALFGLVGLPLGAAIGFEVPMVMGALYREDAFAAGALVSVPGVVVGLVRGLTTSLALTLLVVLAAPVAAFLSGVLGRVGAEAVALSGRVHVPTDVAFGSIADEEAHAAVAQRRRGLILVAVFASLAAIGFATNNLVNAAADRRARSVERDLARRAFQAPDVMRLIVGSPDGSAPVGKGGPFVKPRLGPPLAVVADASYAWARQCVVVEVEGARRTYISRDPHVC